jgi:AbrB family looped-hinge helix DNA binding protein
MVGVEFERKVGPKGQVVIPKEIRKIMGITPETKVYISLENGKIILRTKRRESIEDFLRIIPDEKRRKITIKDVKRRLEEEFEEKWRK